MFNKKLVFLIAGIVLLIAIFDLPYAYYQLLRIFIFGIGTYGVYLCYREKKIGWLWIFGGISVVFNPFIKVPLVKEAWKIIDLVSGILFFVYFRLGKRGKNNIQNKQCMVGKLEVTQKIIEKEYTTEVIFYNNEKEIARELLDDEGNIIKRVGRIPDGMVKQYN